MKKTAITILLLMFCIAIFAACNLTNSASTGSHLSTSTPTQIADNTPTPAPTPSVSKERLTRGTVEGNVYTSNYARLKFTAPDDWRFLSDSETASTLNVSSIYIYDGHSTQLSGVYDSMAQNSVTGTNVIFVFENLEVFDSTEYSEEDYIENIKTSLPDYEFASTEDTSIGTQSFKTVHIMSKSMNISQYYYVRKIDNYMFSFVVSLNGGDTISDVLENISVF